MFVFSHGSVALGTAISVHQYLNNRTHHLSNVDVASGGSCQYFGCSGAANRYLLAVNKHPLRHYIHRVVMLYKRIFAHKCR